MKNPEAYITAVRESASVLKSNEKLEIYMNLGFDGDIFAALTDAEKNKICDAFSVDCVNAEDDELIDLLNDEIVVLQSLKAENISEYTGSQSCFTQRQTRR